MWRRVLVLVILACVCLAVIGYMRDVSRGLAESDAIALAELPEVLAERRVVVVGERHALVEPVEFVKYLVSRTGEGIGFTHLCAELSVSDQESIDQYMNGDDAAMEALAARLTGLPGITAEYLSVFTYVREHNRKQPESAVMVRLIDVKAPVRSTAEEARDQHMFEHVQAILEENPRNRVLVHVGASHAVTCGSIGEPSEKGGRVYLPTLGNLLVNAYVGEVVSVNVLSESDPVWPALRRRLGREEATAFRLTENSGDARAMFRFYYWWRSDRPGRTRANDVFDFVVWYPTCRAGMRL